jgi:tyrosyl-tRNA synthetase
MEAYPNGTNPVLVNVVELITEGELLEAQERSRRRGRPLRVKMGFDPTSPDLHFGHLVALRKLRAFQEWGAHVYALIGDFTARIGDPSGRKATRPRLSEEEVELNAKTYQEQLFRVLDPSKTHVVFNSSWLAPLSLERLLELASTVSVAKLLSRQDFHERLKSEEPLGFHELHYPLLQAYDSYALEADVELGGQDQIFNLLLGRDIQRALGQNPQVVMTLPLLEGLDGRLKMSKSFGNVIALNDPPKEMFGKIMALNDRLLVKYIRLLDPRPYAQLEAVLERLESPSANPMEEKKGFALAMVSWIHGAEDAQGALRFFEERFQKKQVPDSLGEEVITVDTPDVWLGDVLKKLGFVKSSSEFMRKVQEGAVRLERKKVSDPSLRLVPEEGSLVLELGRKMARVRLIPQKPTSLDATKQAPEKNGS